MVDFATQVKRRRGTTAENDAFTGAEGEITVDTEKHQLRIHDGQTQGGFVIGQGGGSGSGRNIGDIFYTTRTDTALAGAVECNGGTYRTDDYTGEGSIGELLESGKLPYVSLAQYASLLTTNGVCGVFGWDGGNAFRVPTLRDVFIECGQASELGDYIPAGLPNITATWAATSYTSGSGTSGAAYVDGTVPTTANGADTRPRVRFDASRSSSIYGNSDTVQPEAIKYRAMIQLFNSTTDEAVATVGTITAQVGELNSRTSGIIDYVVEKQDATAENGYTWYHKYKSGRVEQGGEFSGQASITFPIEMADTHYEFITGLTTLSGSQSFNYNTYSVTVGNSTNRTTTGMSGITVGASIVWRVSGMSAQ